MLALTFASFLINASCLHFYVNENNKNAVVCFNEEIHEGSIFTAKFKVNDNLRPGTDSNIEFVILDSHDRTIKSKLLSSTDKLVFISQNDQMYTMCFKTFANRPIARTKMEYNYDIDDYISTTDFENFEKLGDAEIEIKKMSSSLAEIKKELLYQAIREIKLSSMAAQINKAIKRISTLQALIFVALSIVQMYVLQKFFKRSRII